MSIIVMPTNVRVPTLLDELRARYMEGVIDLREFEVGVEHLLARGVEDEPSLEFMAPGGLSAPETPSPMTRS